MDWIGSAKMDPRPTDMSFRKIKDIGERRKAKTVTPLRKFCITTVLGCGVPHDTAVNSNAKLAEQRRANWLRTAAYYAIP